MNSFRSWFWFFLYLDMLLNDKVGSLEDVILALGDDIVVSSATLTLNFSYRFKSPLNFMSCIDIVVSSGMVACVLDFHGHLKSLLTLTNSQIKC
ncbi:hypothetical protein RchiOBHm_Chr1g0343121 [Rosa chinensis]|uniref:Uncharacterized protein n=1 Tax=Rosa chinensis TaxID=74649 RepID=A0A2P6SE59_ROSCH|nr:hypothetical protein RchiOBHm_Chr1g0343121 [Rosa chinensis]